MEEFLRFTPVYSDAQVTLIENEFQRLKDICYLDHAGATLYSEKQIQHVMVDLSANVYGNPHSLHTSSKSTEDAIDITRYQILQHFNTNSEEYSIVFTSGATAALKIIAECFDYGGKSKGTLVYLENNHTSVLGMRNYAVNTMEVSTEKMANLMKNKSEEHPASKNDSVNNLFVYPAESNFSGTKFPLEWTVRVKDGVLNNIVQTKSENWYVVLDAPCFAATNVLDLSQYKPDFVTVSFYKMFGYPTGLGALLVRKSSEDLLMKKYFGGGTLSMVLSAQNVNIPREVFHERFEDGTLPFSAILAIKQGFETLKRLHLNFEVISNHTFSLARYVYRKLLTLHHSNGKPAAVLYHDTMFEHREMQGGIVNFNLLRLNGTYIGFTEVSHMANLHGIHLRSGCQCNPGACQRFLKLKPSDIINNFKQGHVCGDTNDLIDGVPTGTIRVSFGYMSSKEDADKLLTMIESCFVPNFIRRTLGISFSHISHLERMVLTGKENEIYNQPHKFSQHSGLKNFFQNNEGGAHEGLLKQIFVYPIKSCGSHQVSEQWIIGPEGLEYDREWVIVNAAGVCLTQKQNKSMCLVKPLIDLEKDILKLRFEGYRDIDISLSDNSDDLKEEYISQTKICSKRVIGWDCGDEVSDWLSETLNMPGLRLLRKYNENEKQSFANKGMFLMVNSKSVEWLTNKIRSDDLSEDLNTTIQRFRPNFVVELSKPFQENDISDFWIGNHLFKSKGTCTRCHMICINQETGLTSKEPLLTLSNELKGKLRFGIYLSLENDIQNVLKLNSSVFKHI